MSDRPPSPASVPATPSVAPRVDDDRVLATTAQLAAALESAHGVTVDVDALEALLLECDRRGCLQWETVTETGDYLWDVTDAPDRIAETVASVVARTIVDRLDRRLADDL